MPPHTNWGRESIVAAMRNWYELYREPPRITDWNRDPHYPSHATVRYHCGSWRAAIEAAGIAPRPRGAQGHRLGPRDAADRVNAGRVICDDRRKHS
jgi:hypothetical protein